MIILLEAKRGRNLKNRKRLSIKWKIFAYLIGFTVFLLGLLWYFQIVHLSNFYEYFKKKEINDVTEELLDYVNNPYFKDYINQYTREYDISINLVDEGGRSILSSGLTEHSHIYVADKKMLKEMIEKANADDGMVMYEVDGRFKNDMPPHRPDEPFGNYMKDAKSVVCICEVNSDGEELYLLVSALITPVDATVHTLRIQFIYISIIFFVMAIIIALIISKVVSKPIVRINESAKELADGKFDIEFEGDGYREVQELSYTLNYAAAELGKSGELQKDLIANVSHDLRTPLTMITAYAEVMRDIPGENTPENVQVIIDEATRLTTLVNDMLDLSKLQAGVSELNRVHFDFTTNILAVLKRFSKLTEQVGYAIRFEYRDNVKVFADEYKIYQVIYNLINNAINYAGEDREVIVRQIVYGDIIRLEVEDHGKGIEEGELEYIWDRYYKVDKTHRRAVQGSGLGLSIVQNILKLHDYKYGVRSIVGKGSVFWFELPKADGGEIEEDI